MTCQGSSSTIPRGGECNDCGGVGKIKYRKQIKIDVPAGELSRVEIALRLGQLIWGLAFFFFFLPIIFHTPLLSD